VIIEVDKQEGRVMPFTGDEKKAYQREYMRKKRLGLTSGSNKGLTQNTGKSLKLSEARARIVGCNGLALKDEGSNLIF
jgi:hypothetical protein